MKLFKEFLSTTLFLLNTFFKRKKNDIQKKILNLFRSSWYIYYIMFHLSILVILFPYTINFITHMFLNFFNIMVSLFYNIVAFGGINLSLLYLYDIVEKKRNVDKYF